LNGNTIKTQFQQIKKGQQKRKDLFFFAALSAAIHQN
jgi:hypothetical protein